MRVTADGMAKGYERMAPAERIDFWRSWIASGEAEGAFGTTMPAPISTIHATPFDWVDPRDIAPRAWIYGWHYARRFISATIAPGGVGKSSLTIVEALAIATGQALLDIRPAEQTAVWLWNGEDPLEELQRRIAAACQHFEIGPKDIEGRLFVDSGRDGKLVIAEQTRDGAVVSRPVVDAIKRSIAENGIGLMIVDPFVACHRATENDNGAIETVAAAWAEIADATGCAIELVHHSRKTGGAETTVDDARGASALLAKARSARVVNGMTKEEAEKADVENHRLYFRCENGKANLAIPADKATWYRLASIDLGNGPAAAGGMGGDSVGVVTAWEWPEALDGVTVDKLREVQTAIGQGRWRENVQAADWVGKPIAGVLGLDTGNKAHRSKIGGLVKIWIGTGMLVVVTGKDGKGMDRTFIEVGERA